MFNRKECGLHHPGNVIPSCKSCNKRTRDKESKEYVGWVKHLETQCDSSEEFKIRKEKIISHINSENYPKLTVDEKNALKPVAESLYERISNELPKSIDLFKKIDATLVKGIKKRTNFVLYGHFLDTLLFRVNILLAETCCYN